MTEHSTIDPRAALRMALDARARAKSELKALERHLEAERRLGYPLPQYIYEQVAELKAGLKKGRLLLAAARLVA